jgi:hypothetical protein
MKVQNSKITLELMMFKDPDDTPRQVQGRLVHFTLSKTKGQKSLYFLKKTIDIKTCRFLIWHEK